MVYSAGSQEPLYMSPTEPPISVYGTNAGTKALRLENTGIYGRLENAGIYGTVRSERSTVYGTLPRNYLNNRISQFSTPAFMYATLSKQQLGARRSLKEAGLQEEDGGSERSSSEEEASELRTLVEVAPKEGSVYFVLGKVYKKLGQPSQAMVNLTRALDLSPKDAQQIKAAILNLEREDNADEQEEY